MSSREEAHHMLTDAGPSIVVGTRTRGTRVSSSLSKSLRLSFPQYGFKAGRSDEAFPTYRLAIVLRALGFPRESLLGVRGKGWGAPPGERSAALPQGPSLRSGLCWPSPSSLNRPHPPQLRAPLDFAAVRFIRDAFAVPIPPCLARRPQLVLSFP